MIPDEIVEALKTLLTRLSTLILIMIIIIIIGFVSVTFFGKDIPILNGNEKVTETDTNVSIFF